MYEHENKQGKKKMQDALQKSWEAKQQLLGKDNSDMQLFTIYVMARIGYELQLSISWLKIICYFWLLKQNVLNTAVSSKHFK